MMHKMKAGMALSHKRMLTEVPKPLAKIRGKRQKEAKIER